MQSVNHRYLSSNKYFYRSCRVMERSIPSAVNTALSHQATELEVTALCSLMKEISRFISMPRMGLVLSSELQLGTN